MQYGEQRISNNWYLFDNVTGAMQTGQRRINGHWYLFNQKTGSRQTGLKRVSAEKKTVYYDGQGRMQYGEQKIGSKWYLFKNITGAMQTGLQKVVDNRGVKKTVYYASNGQMQNGEQRINKHWYMFDRVTGAMQTGFYNNKEQNKKVYYAQNGQIQYGEKKIQNEWYLFAPVTGKMQTGFQKIKNPTRTVYYAASGKMIHGWQTINGHNYFFNRTNGNMSRGMFTVAGIDYIFASNGQLQTEANAKKELYRQNVAKKISELIKDKFGVMIDFDWNNQNDHYRAFTLHDTAQLVAAGYLQADKLVIQDSLYNNGNMQGSIQKITVDSLKEGFTNATVNAMAQKFVDSLGQPDKKELQNSVLGVGAVKQNDTLKTAVLLFDYSKVAKDPRVRSKVAPMLSESWNAPGVNVTLDNGLKVGRTFGKEDVGNLNNLADTFMLKGRKGELIGAKNLKEIFKNLSGRSGALIGTKNYYVGNDPYHYEFWLYGQSMKDKEYNFEQANLDTKYGDDLLIPYSATLFYGIAPGTKEDQASKPANEMTAEEIKASYENGTNTGLSQVGVNVGPVKGMKENTIRGVDVSSYLALRDAGVKFYDFDGNEAPLFKVLHDSGVNYIRLRLWNDPYNEKGQNYGGGIDDERTILETAKEASKYGIKVLLDFQYSDFWADPATQAVPKAWEKETTDSLKKSIYNYTHKVLDDLKNLSVEVGMVQVGNEITKGMMDNIGSTNHVWGDKHSAAQLTGYINSGSSAVHDVYQNALITVHVESPNMSKYEMIMTALKNAGAYYDVLGSSYYPFWGWGSNNPDNISNIEKMVKDKFGKKFVVLETGWLNSTYDSDGTNNNIGYAPEHYKSDPQGQVNEMHDLYAALMQHDNGLGAFYWEPAWIAVKAGWNNWRYNKNVANINGTGWANGNSQGYYPDSKLFYQGQPAWGGSSWYNNTLFDDQGRPLQSLSMYNGFLNGYKSKNKI